MGRDLIDQQKVLDGIEISTHTPAWGATDMDTLKFRIVFNFNSHARVGRDRPRFLRLHQSSGISTHTPAWGATLRGKVKSERMLNFNSHARVGRDLIEFMQSAGMTNFNSHARVGRDRVNTEIAFSGMKNFNSHARVGRDAQMMIHKPWSFVFQLTRPRGARRLR